MDKKMIRFINSSYKDLFSIPDGGNVVLTHFDGETAIRPCQHMGDYHTKIGYRVFHICEFAEIMERNGTIYVPEVLQKGDTWATYEIYQIKDIRCADYCFRSYEEASTKINKGDYTRMYAGMLASGMTLEDIYARHNMGNRPFGDRMRSLSMSDVIAINRGGKTISHYVDTFGFKEVTKHFHKERQEKVHSKKKKHEPER